MNIRPVSPRPADWPRLLARRLTRLLPRPLPRLLPRVPRHLTWLLGLLAIPPALSAPTQAALGLEAIAQATSLASEAARALAPQGARIVALPGALDARLQLAPCARVQAFLPAGVSAWGRTRVGLRCAQGSVAWQVFLPVTVQVWAPAVVAAAALPAGAQIDPTHLTQAEVDWASAPGAAHARASDLQDRVLARPVLAGQPLRVGDLRPRQWFTQGETVQVVARGAGFAVSTEGQAMGAGLEGQPVRVRTESGRVVVGVAAGLRRVEINL